MPGIEAGSHRAIGVDRHEHEEIDVGDDVFFAEAVTRQGTDKIVPTVRAVLGTVTHPVRFVGTAAADRG